MDLGLPARQAATVLDEGPGIEVADAADVGIERQVAAEAQHHRHLQLDDLLPVPAGHQIEAAENSEKKSLSGPHRHVDVGKARQAGAQQMAYRCRARRSGVRRAWHRASAWPAIRSGDPRAPSRPGAVILRRAKGRMAWRTSENIVLVGSESTCGVGSLPHQLLGQPVGAAYQRQNVPTKYGGKDRFAPRESDPPKKTPGQKARRVKQGGFTSGRRGIMRIPSFEREKQRTVRVENLP